MLFLGRPLASVGDFSIWEEHNGEGVLVQNVTRGIVFRLERSEAEALAEALTTALKAAAQPEARKDTVRRYQIARARIGSLLDRVKDQPSDRSPEQ